MDFKLSDDAIMIQNVAREYLKEKCPASFVREMERDEAGFSRNMWKEIASLGWTGILHDESYGGSGATFLDMFVVFEEIGRTQFPSPLFCSAVLSSLILAEAGDETKKKTWMTALVKGEKIFTTALVDERGRLNIEDPSLLATDTGKGTFVIRGTRLLVPYAHVADAIIVCANACGPLGAGPSGVGPTLFLIADRTNGHSIVPLSTMSCEKTFAVVFEGAEVPVQSIIGTVGRGAEYIQRILPQALLLKCAEMIGGMERVVEMTVGHVRERHQFGASLGSLQAVQHNCADMATLLETSRWLAYQAASLLSDGLPCDKEVAMAKAWCSDSYKKVTWIAHQLHGGIGFTEEYDLHFYYKHAKEAELSFGDARFHRERVADAMGL